MNWNAIKDSIDVSELEAALNIDVISTSGSEDVARCPLPSHSGMDRNPSFSINREKKLFNCFTCGKGGTLLMLVEDIKMCSKEDAYAFCRLYTSGLQTGSGDALISRLESLLHGDSKKSESILPFYRSAILEPWINDVPNTDFFHSRGIEPDAISLLKLGYDSKHTRGSYVGEAAIIPHFWQGRLVGYQERWIGNRPANIPKYTNTKDFPKGTTLYNYDNIKSGDDIVVVESAMTVAYLLSMGVPAIATFGASVQAEQIRHIKNLCSVGSRVLLSFDNDAAGFKATDKVVSQLKNTVPLFIIPPPDQEKGDLNDLTPDEVSCKLDQARPWWTLPKERQYGI